MNTLSIAGLLVLVLATAAALVWVRRHGGSGQQQATESDRLDTLAAWPPEATLVLTVTERLAYGILRRALPDCMILAQVPLSRFLKVSRRQSYSEWLRRLGNQCVDLVVCDTASQVLAVIDIQAPAGQASESARKRLNRLARSLRAAGIPLHVWTEGALPSVQAARETIIGPTRNTTELTSQPIPLAEEPSPAPPTQATRKTVNPFDDSGRDSTQDERIEVREAPPSTWFDDIDSKPTPLPSAPTKAKTQR